MIITTDYTNPDADLQEANHPEESHADTRRRHARHDRYTVIRNDLQNLVAASRATLRAHAEGEDDSLYYLRDELQAQGHLPAEFERIDYRKRP